MSLIRIVIVFRFIISTVKVQLIWNFLLLQCEIINSYFHNKAFNSVLTTLRCHL